MGVDKNSKLGVAISAAMSAEKAGGAKPDRFAKADAATGFARPNPAATEPVAPPTVAPPPLPAVQATPAAQASTPGRGAGKAKVIRDGFSMPASDYELIDEIQRRLIRREIVATKSQVLRAAIRRFVKLSDDQIVKLIADVDRLKPGPKAE